jgi:hypothetical protein
VLGRLTPVDCSAVDDGAISSRRSIPSERRAQSGGRRADEAAVVELNRCIGGERQTRPAGSIRIPRGLVRYLRKGVRGLMAGPLATLSVQALVEDGDTALLKRELRRFDEGRALIEAIGWTDAREERDFDLDIHRWGHLGLTALRAEHERELARHQDAEAQGFAPMPKDLPALGRLVAHLRDIVHPSPCRRRAGRRARQRGDG